MESRPQLQIPYQLRQIVAPSVRLIVHRALKEIGNMEDEKIDNRRKLGELQIEAYKKDQDMELYK